MDCIFQPVACAMCFFLSNWHKFNFPGCLQLHHGWFASTSRSGWKCFGVQSLPLKRIIRWASVITTIHFLDVGLFIADIVTDLVNGIRLWTGCSLSGCIPNAPKHPIWGGLTVIILWSLIHPPFFPHKSCHCLLAVMENVFIGSVTCQLLWKKTTIIPILESNNYHMRERTLDTWTSCFFFTHSILSFRFVFLLLLLPWLVCGTCFGSS